MNAEIENEAASFISRNICFEFSVQCHSKYNEVSSQCLGIGFGAEHCATMLVNAVAGIF
jgi:hypothetical protein